MFFYFSQPCLRHLFNFTDTPFKNAVFRFFVELYIDALRSECTYYRIIFDIEHLKTYRLQLLY